MNRPVRKVKRPIRRVARPPEAPTKRACPKCESPEVRIATVVGEVLVLVVSRWCADCGHAWKTRKRRSDVCDHGKALIVPCADCGRTWETIDADR